MHRVHRGRRASSPKIFSVIIDSAVVLQPPGLIEDDDVGRGLGSLGLSHILPVAVVGIRKGEVTVWRTDFHVRQGVTDVGVVQLARGCGVRLDRDKPPSARKRRQATGYGLHRLVRSDSDCRRRYGRGSGYSGTPPACDSCRRRREGQNLAAATPWPRLGAPRQFAAFTAIRHAARACSSDSSDDSESKVTPTIRERASTWLVGCVVELERVAQRAINDARGACRSDLAELGIRPHGNWPAQIDVVE